MPNGRNFQRAQSDKACAFAALSDLAAYSTTDGNGSQTFTSVPSSAFDPGSHPIAAGDRVLVPSGTGVGIYVLTANSSNWNLARSTDLATDAQCGTRTVNVTNGSGGPSQYIQTGSTLIGLGYTRGSNAATIVMLPKPRGGGLDDGPAINALIATKPAGTHWDFHTPLGATYTVATPIRWPSNTTVTSLGSTFVNQWQGDSSGNFSGCFCLEVADWTDLGNILLNNVTFADCAAYMSPSSNLAEGATLAFGGSGVNIRMWRVIESVTPLQLLLSATVGTSVVTLTSSGSPVLQAPIVCKITNGGTIGTSASYQISTDGTTFGAIQSLGTANSIDVTAPGGGTVTYHFAAGTVATNQTITICTLVQFDRVFFMSCYAASAIVYKLNSRPHDIHFHGIRFANDTSKTNLYRQLTMVDADKCSVEWCEFDARGTSVYSGATIVSFDNGCRNCSFTWNKVFADALTTGNPSFSCEGDENIEIGHNRFTGPIQLTIGGMSIDLHDNIGTSDTNVTYGGHLIHSVSNEWGSEYIVSNSGTDNNPCETSNIEIDDYLTSASGLAFQVYTASGTTPFVRNVTGKVTLRNSTASFTYCNGVDVDLEFRNTSTTVGGLIGTGAGCNNLSIGITFNTTLSGKICDYVVQPQSPFRIKKFRSIGAGTPSVVNLVESDNAAVTSIAVEDYDDTNLSYPVWYDSIFQVNSAGCVVDFVNAKIANTNAVIASSAAGTVTIRCRNVRQLTAGSYFCGAGPGATLVIHSDENCDYTNSLAHFDAGSGGTVVSNFGTGTTNASNGTTEVFYRYDKMTPNTPMSCEWGASGATGALSWRRVSGNATPANNGVYFKSTSSTDTARAVSINIG